MFRNVFARLLALSAILVLTGMALSPGAAAAEERPFKAMWTGNAHLKPIVFPTLWLNEETGEGEATHLGLFTWESVEVVTFITNPDGVVESVAVDGKSFTMTAANGDKVFGTYSTEGFPNKAGDLIIHGTFTITGGTGRFAGATGGGDLFAIAFFSEGLPFIGLYEGTIDF